MSRDRHGHEARWRERELERRQRDGKGRKHRNAAHLVERLGASVGSLAELAGADPCTCKGEPDPVCPVHNPADAVLEREREARRDQNERLLQQVARHAGSRRAMAFAPARIYFAHPVGGKSLAARKMLDAMLAADPTAQLMVATLELDSVGQDALNARVLKARQPSPGAPAPTIDFDDPVFKGEP